MQNNNTINTSISDSSILNLDMLNSFLREYIATYESVTDAPAEYLVTAILPSLGAAISTKQWIQWGNKKIYPNMWVMLVGPSTLMRKSTALEIGSSILRQLNEEQIDRHYILPNDGSFAGFLEILTTEKNGILKHSEVASMLENMSKGYNLSMKSLFTDFFDVPNLHKIQLKETGETHIEEPIFGIAAGTTLNWLKKNITNNDRESGFLARFLYCYRDAKTRILPIPQVADVAQVQKMRSIFLKLLDCKRTVIELDPSYEEGYVSFYDKVDILLRNPFLDDGTKSLLGRLQTDYFIKLTILECTLNGKTRADAEIAHRVSYLAEYYIGQANNIMNMLLKTDMAKNQDKILAYLKERSRASTTEIHRLFNNRLHANNLHSTMKSLEDARLVQKVTRDKTSYYEILRDSQTM